jgi:hypothetical protein
MRCYAGQVATGETFPFLARITGLQAGQADKLVKLLGEVGLQADFDGFWVEFMGGQEDKRAFDLAVLKLRCRGYRVLLG